MAENKGLDGVVADFSGIDCDRTFADCIKANESLGKGKQDARRLDQNLRLNSVLQARAIRATLRSSQW